MSTITSQLFYDLKIISDWIYAENGFSCNMYSFNVTTAEVYVCKEVELQLKTVCPPPSHYRSYDYGKQPHCNILIDTGS
jgi:hypothetical protein